MRTWIARNLNDVLFRRPRLSVQSLTHQGRAFSTVVAHATSDNGNPQVSALAIFTGPQADHEAAVWMRQAQDFGGKVKTQQRRKEAA